MTNCASAQTDLFQKAINNLSTIGYIKKPCAAGTATIDSGYCCVNKPADNWLNKRVTSCNEFNKTYGSSKPINTIPVKGIETIREYFLKSTIDKGGHLYARFAIEEWTCTNTAAAEEILTIIKGYGDTWECINKAPICYGINGNQLYFIQSGGWYCLDDIPLLIKTLKATLGKETRFFSSFRVGDVDASKY